MLIKITLNNRWPTEAHPPIEIRSLLHSACGEIDPDVFFDALQRLGGWEGDDHFAVDLSRIDTKYHSNEGYHPSLRVTLGHLRRSMERKQAPSMSVGDTIDIYATDPITNARTPIVRHTCESVGWSSGPVPEAVVTM